MKLRFWFVAVYIGWPVAVALGSPTVAFNTLGPGNSLSSQIGYALSYQSIATPFTNNTPGSLDSLRLGLSQTQGRNMQFQISLRADAGGVPSDSSLEVWSLIGAPKVLPGNRITPIPADTLFASLTHPALAQGAVYWIVEQETGLIPDGHTGMADFNNQHINGPVFTQAIDRGPHDKEGSIAGPWTPLSGTGLLPAIQVNINAVPEPGSAVVLASGLAALAAWGWRRRGC